ncbi:hypothetical protein [Siminovitchia fortis]|uniref:hypothetical protein n=1 Tax=Siminovitchia fortis TaxID=254758 RepID=UPI0011AB0946|nr:hypothetical protein [Siminovitchia fortis]
MDGLHAVTACIYLQMVAFNMWQLYLFRYLRKYDQMKDPQVAVAERMRIECEFDPWIIFLILGLY